MLKDIPAPVDILNIDNPVVKYWVNLWRYGIVTWEQALQGIIVDFLVTSDETGLADEE